MDSVDYEPGRFGEIHHRLGICVSQREALVEKIFDKGGALQQPLLAGVESAPFALASAQLVKKRLRQSPLGFKGQAASQYRSLRIGWLNPTSLAQSAPWIAVNPQPLIISPHSASD